MPPRMTTRSSGRSTVAPRGGRTGRRTSRGGGRTGEPTGRGGGRTREQDGQGGGRGNGVNGGIDEVPDFFTVIDQQLSSCSLIGKALTWWNTQVNTRGREAAVGMTWEDFKTLKRDELCPNNEMQKLETEFWCHVMVRASHAAYTDRFHDLARLVPHLVTPENKRIKRGNGEDPSRDGNVKDDNKRSRTGRAFSTTTNPVRKEYMGSAPKCTNCNFHHNPRCLVAACPRLNQAPRQGGNRLNQAMAIEGGQGHGNNGNQARGRAFVMGVEEARQDPNIVTGTFTLNNHYATTLFDSGADYSFVSTTFITLLDIEPNNLGMDWLSRHKAEIVCHEKVVRIPLPHGKMLRVLGERLEEKAKHLMSVKTEGQKLKDIVVVRNFYELFLDDLSGLPPS
ncbi:putative reverse transcriptase domain-containing protein [Tanacetum coccineum]